MIRRLTTLAPIMLALVTALGVRLASAGSGTETDPQPPPPAGPTDAPAATGSEVFAGFDAPPATNPPAPATTTTDPAGVLPQEPSGDALGSWGQHAGMLPNSQFPAATVGKPYPAAPADGSMPDPAVEGQEPPPSPLGEAPPLPANDGFEPAQPPAQPPAPPGPGSRPDPHRPVSEPERNPAVVPGGAEATPATTTDPRSVETPPASAGESPLFPRDDQVHPVQTPGAAPAPTPEGANLPPARERTEGTEVPRDAPVGDPLIPSPDRLKEGPNAVGVTVQVNAPQIANLNLESTVQILVKNSGPSEATNVRVLYPLPEGIEFLTSDPPKANEVQKIYIWQLNTLAPGAERVIKVKVKYTRKGAYDHAAIVTVQGGAKARTQARQPQLRAEVRVDKASVLKGQKVRFDITVSNFGDHPARDVVIQARLDAGLHHTAGRDLIYSLKSAEHLDALAPGQSVTLPLVVEAEAMGKQACEVSVASPDEPGEISSHADVEVTAPQLQVALDGPAERYPDATGTYTVNVTNGGTAAAKKVLVGIRIPLGGTPEAAEPHGALWQSDNRTLYWRVDDFPPGETQAFKVRVKMGSVGKLSIQAGASASGLPPTSDTKVTEITGIPHIRVSVDEPRGVFDVGEETEFQIRLINDGSAEARNVAVTARFSDLLKIISVSGPDAKAPAPQQPPDGVAVLPAIASLPPGADVTLSVRVQAVKEGIGSCEVSVSHQDLDPGLAVKTSTVTRITAASGIPRR